MAKAPDTVVGVDIGRYSLKSVRIQRRDNGSVAVTHYGFHVPRQWAKDGVALAQDLKALFRDMGASAKVCAFSVSSSDALLRVVEQPETSREMLREGLRLGGATLLHQDVRDFVIDCGQLSAARPAEFASNSRRYLVGGLPRAEVDRISEAAGVAGITVQGLRPSAVAALNAFAFACADFVARETFVIVEIGPAVTTVMGGVRGELVLIRSIDFGSLGFLEALCGLTESEPAEVMAGLDRDDEVIVAYARAAIGILGREISSSLSFLEHQHEGRAERIFISGGPSVSAVFQRIMSEEVGIPCQVWNVLEWCKVEMPKPRRALLDLTAIDLNGAWGAALSALHPEINHSLHLDLYHEVAKQKSKKRHDPLRYAAMGIGALGLGFVGDYLYNLYELQSVTAEVESARTDYERLLPKAEAAQQMGVELSASIAASTGLIKRVENRFYWSPTLESLTRVVPPEVQVTSFSGVVTGEEQKKVSIVIEGIAAGAHPRQQAEDVRQKLGEQFAARYRNASATFQKLEDSAETVDLNGRATPTAEFTIILTLETGEAPATPPPPRRRRSEDRG